MKLMVKHPARLNQKYLRGFTPIILIVVVVIIGLIIVGVATGALKGSFTVSKNKPLAQETAKTEESNKQNVTTPLPSPVLQLGETYTSSQKDFSIRPPKSWSVNEEKSITFYEGSTIQGSPAALVVTTVPLGELKGAQFSTLVDTVRVSLKKQYPSSTIQTDQGTKIDGNDAHLLVFENSQDGITYQIKAYLVVNSDNLYNILTLVKKESITKYNQTLEESVKSFKLLNK